MSPDEDWAARVRELLRQGQELPELAPIHRRLEEDLQSARIGEAAKTVELAAEALPGTLAHVFSQAALLRIKSLRSRGLL
ncbi:MAG: hypothetical protein GC160_03410 [Acidobacteria bacterium]|nr:hypothetical protein [Acidobacteriota bacterium]